MPRQRTIRPEFFRDKTMARLGVMPALVYTALWCWADDGGVARIEPDVLKGEVFTRWVDITHGALVEALVSLHAAGRIIPYCSGDELYAEIPTLGKHSPINHPSKFRYPRGGEVVSDIRAWLSGQYTHGVLLEGSAPIRHSPSAVSHSPIPLPSTKTDVSPWPELARPDPPTDYTTRCTVALNAAVQMLAPSVLATRADKETKRGTAATWQRDGIPVELAERVIADRCRGADPRDPPRSLKFFDGAVRQAFELSRAPKRLNLAERTAQTPEAA